jgi:hypothetical protein
MVSGCDFKLGRSGYIRRRLVAKGLLFWVFVEESSSQSLLNLWSFLRVIMCNTAAIIYICPFI